MAHFYGEVQGQRGRASRLGSKASGLQTVAASWQGAIEVNLYHREDLDEDWVTVWMREWYSAGSHAMIYDGPVGRFEPQHPG